VIGTHQSQEQRILVESVFLGLCGEVSPIDQIPCIISTDQTTLFVWFGDFDAKNFSKTLLFNLVNTAEQISPACQKLVFILNRDVEADSKYREFQELFQIIDAKRMTKSIIKSIVKEDSLTETIENYGFFELLV
jgi:hypothetical protein